MKNQTRLILSVLSLFLLASACKSPEKAAESTPVSLELKKAEVFVTAKDTDLKLTSTGSIEFTDLAQPVENEAAILVDPTHQFQTLVGIGGALTDASAETYYKLPKEKQKEFIEAYFSLEKGIGYSIGRTHINSCDFSSSSYAYTETENDTLLANFSIEPDRKYRIPFIKEAIAAAGGSLTLFASPWSPPAWMKSNKNMLQGGILLPEYHQTWANYYVKFFEEYQKEGIPFWGLTVQNEPMATQTWESCIYTAEDERDFVKNYLGPTLAKSAFKDAKLIIWDHNRGLMVQRAAAVYNDPEASKYVWGTGFHWYVGDHFDNVQLHAEAFPDKNLIFTEGCNYPFNYDSLANWHWGENYGKSLVNDLNAGTAAWTDWNVLLDETGGPNHVNNFCYAPVIGNTKTGELVYMSSYYYLGHFSKFIRPGAKRVLCSSNDDELQATSFLNPDGSLATVVLNLTGKTKDFNVWINGKTVKSTTRAHSIMTFVSR